MRQGGATGGEALRAGLVRVWGGETGGAGEGIGVRGQKKQLNPVQGELSQSS